MKHWSQYWKTANALSSFAEGEAALGYEAEVKSFWENSIGDLPDEATIVDIGTGNGALAVLINEYGKANGKKWTIHGVDAAEIDPDQVAARNEGLKEKLDGITFHGQTDMAALPFKDGSVDCIVSQFAFEYADQEPALKEALRVLKPGGKLVAMSHHKKAGLIKESQSGIKVLDHVLNNTPLFIQADLLARMASQFLEANSFEKWQQSQFGQATTKTTQWIMATIQQEYSKDEERRWADDVIGKVANIMQSVTTADTAKQAVERLAIQYSLLQGFRLRLEDQLNAAYTESSVKKLIKAVEKEKATGGYQPFELSDETFAWTISIQK